jgi:hypothetical protein
MRGVTQRRVSVAFRRSCLLLLLGAAACSSAGSPPSSTTTPAGAGSRAASLPAARASTTTATDAAQPQAKSRPATTRSSGHHSSVPGVPAVDVPDPRLTPGAAFAGVTVARICAPGYASSVRNVPASEKERVYAEYHVVHVPRAHEVDHLISLELGGSNDIRNLWPQPYAGRWNARVKDRLENLLHTRVCAGGLRLGSAQHLISRDWPAAYRRYLGSPAAARAATPVVQPASGNGYYTSAYPTATTIYCADDPGWRLLSARYLRHFPTLAAALAAFPGRHLHRPC